MKKILIIEDDNLVTAVLEFLLKKEGYETHLAKDGNEGLEKISSVQPNLIITDVMMPFKSGLELTAHVKKNTNIPIIIISALGKEDQTVLDAFKLGADDFVAKPFNPLELILRVKRFI